MNRRDFLRIASTAGVAVGAGPGWAAPGRVPRRPLGATGATLPVVGLGGITVSGRGEAEARRMVDRAFERGIDYVDVAPTYGDAEQLLGAALAPYRERCFLAGKTNKRTAAEAGRELAASLGRLRTDRLDLYQLHALRSREDVETAFGAGGAVETLRAAREAGAVRFLGFSAHSVEAALAAMDRFAFDTVMFPVNQALWSAGFGPQVAARAADQGLGVLALKSLARGRWPEGAERSGPTWYEPHADPGRMRSAAAFSLSKGAASLLPPGDPGLYWRAVDACIAPADPAPAAEGEEDTPPGAGGPLFRYPDWS